MQVVLDTNSLIRFFTNDVAERAQKVKKLFKEEKEITIPEVVFPELEYILNEQYDTSREKLIAIFQFLSSQKNIKLSINVKNAIRIFAATKLDIADSIIAAYSLKGSLASFDKELLRVEKVNSFWKD